MAQLVYSYKVGREVSCNKGGRSAQGFQIWKPRNPDVDGGQFCEEHAPNYQGNDQIPSAAVANRIPSAAVAERTVLTINGQNAQTFPGRKTPEQLKRLVENTYPSIRVSDFVLVEPGVYNINIQIRDKGC